MFSLKKKKKNVQGKLSHEHILKNSQQNISKPNPAMYKKK